ncbi:MAG: SCO family protein [Hyphomicrobiaceae bacterium]
MLNLKPSAMLFRGLALLMILSTFTFGVLATGTPSVATDAKVYVNPRPVVAFNLQDANGKVFTKQQLTGKWSLILLGFTHCPDICPFTLQNLAHVRREMSTRVSPARLPQIVFVGVDPDRDRPVLGDYVRYFDDSIVGITGQWPEIKKLVEGLDGFVRINGKERDANAYDVRHSAVISLVSPEGKLVAGINPPLQPKQASIFITETMLHHSRQQAKKK